MGSTISWCQSSPSRLVGFALTRQTDGNTSRFYRLSSTPKRDFGVMCAMGCDGSSSSESEAEPYNIWNALLAALVHFRIGEVLQPLLTSEEMGLVGFVMPLCLRRVMRRSSTTGMQPSTADF